MNLSQLRFANAVASTGSFTLAATECCVTQPTLSNGIAQLEDELGARLFVRTTRRVALTSFGLHILPYLSEVLKAQATLVHQTEAFLKPDKRLIRIGTSPLIGANLLELMIEPFRQQNPDVDIVLREMNIADLYRMLDAGLIDFVFGSASEVKTAYTTTFLYHESLYFIPRGGLWQRKPQIQSVQLKDIADEIYVMVPDACGLARATRALFRSHRRKLHEYSGEAMSYQVLEGWAALGIGAAILPRSKLTTSGHASYPIMDKTNHAIMLSYEAAWPRNGNHSTHLLEFIKHLRRVVPAIVAGLEPGI